jgi:hypothetical protein
MQSTNPYTRQTGKQPAKQQTDDQLQLWQFQHNIQVRHLAEVNLVLTGSINNAIESDAVQIKLLI